MHDCGLCGQSFDSVGARIIHIERERCPEVDDENDKVRAETRHVVDEITDGDSDA